MRKSIVSPSAVTATPISDLWRDLERIARVEISSEDEQFPIEHALGKKETTGWRAAGTGPQLIRLHFDEPYEHQADSVAFCGQCGGAVAGVCGLCGVGLRVEGGGAAAVELQPVWFDRGDRGLHGESERDYDAGGADRSGPEPRSRSRARSMLRCRV